MPGEEEEDARNAKTFVPKLFSLNTEEEEKQYWTLKVAWRLWKKYNPQKYKTTSFFMYEVKMEINGCALRRKLSIAGAAKEIL